MIKSFLFNLSQLWSLKKNYFEKGIKDNNDILDDDLTIIGIGK